MYQDADLDVLPEQVRRPLALGAALALYLSNPAVDRWGWLEKLVTTLDEARFAARAEPELPPSVLARIHDAATVGRLLLGQSDESFSEHVSEIRRLLKGILNGEVTV